MGLVLIIGGLRNLFLAAVSLEIVSWVFILLVEKFFRFKYLVVQRAVFFLMVLGILRFRNLLVLALLVKLALPPFHVWFLNVAAALKNVELLFFLSPHKILPLFLFGKVVSHIGGLFLFSLFLVTRRVLILATRGVFYILVVSSLNHTV